MFETRDEHIAPLSVFLFRLFYTVSGGLFLIVIIIAVGMLSFHVYEKMAWVDAFTNSAMTFADMGLTTQPKSYIGKMFASVYALFCQFAFFAIFALIFSPIIHRLYHQFHKEPKRRAQK